MEKLGCEKAFLDPAMYLYFRDSNPDDIEHREPLGMAVTHVDDVLHSGDEEFEEKIMKNLKQALNLDLQPI